MRSLRRIVFSRFLLALAPLLPGPHEAAAQATPPRDEVVARIDSIIRATLAAEPAPGITVAVVRGSDTLVLRGYGLADVENRVPATDSSVFRIGSVTKQFTAAAIMKLVEQGRIRLDAPLSEYLTDYQGPGRDVTIHQLLNHTSGIPSYTGLGPRFWDRSRLDLTNAEMLELWAADSLEFAPGSRWSYNNSAYYMLGMVLQRVTGEHWADHLRSTQFEPLGLTRTSFCTHERIIPDRAAGYDWTEGRLVNASPLSMHLPGAAGALCSTARDLVRWNTALVSGRVVSADSYTRMTTPTALTDGETNPYGYGLENARLGEVHAIEHGGGINGFNSMLSWYPEQELTIAIIVNGPARSGELQRRIARAVLGMPEPVVLDLPTTEAERARYVGTYDLAPGIPLQVRIFEQEGRLFAQATGQGALPLRYVGEDTWEAPPRTTIRMRFELEGERAVSFTLHQGGRAMPAKRID